jgi:uncharacterized protein (TIGR02246 family)
VRQRAARRLVAGGVLLIAACAPAATGRFSPGADERAARHDEIVAMLARSATNWNRGDLDAFVADYAPGSETTYIGGRGLLRGTDAIRAAYAPRFAAGGVRDSLSFVLVDVDPLAPDVLNVIATYILARRVGGRDSVTARGPTSLVMRRVDGRWRIVHDHSS